MNFLRRNLCLSLLSLTLCLFSLCFSSPPAPFSISHSLSLLHTHTPLPPPPPFSLSVHFPFPSPPHLPVPSAEQGHLGMNHTFKISTYQVGKASHQNTSKRWLAVLHTTRIQDCSPMPFRYDIHNIHRNLSNFHNSQAQTVNYQLISKFTFQLFTQLRKMLPRRFPET